MTLRSLQESPLFGTDFDRQIAWYTLEAGEDAAWRFQAAVDATITRLLRQPTLGRIRQFKNPVLKNLRSLQVNSPFHRFIIFFRVTETELLLERLMEGSRDLPHRLAEFD